MSDSAVSRSVVFIEQADLGEQRLVQRLALLKLARRGAQDFRAVDLIAPLVGALPQVPDLLDPPVDRDLVLERRARELRGGVDSAELRVARLIADDRGVDGTEQRTGQSLDPLLLLAQGLALHHDVER